MRNNNQNSKPQVEDLKEDNLRDEVILPYLKKKFPSSTVEDVCGKEEHNHFCDIIITHYADSDKKERPFKEGIQLKTKSSGQGYLDSDIKQIISRILYGMKYIPLDRFYFISTSIFTTNTKEFISEGIKKLGREYEQNIKIFFWDIVDLKRELRSENAENLPQIPEIRIPSLIEEQRAFPKNNVFKSYYSFQIFLELLKAKDVEKAKEEISKAIELLRKENKKRRYFQRTLLHFYEQWQFVVINDSIEDYDFRNQDIIILVNKASIKNLLRDKYPETFNLMADVQYILYQLFLMRSVYVSAPSGLSSLQICRLLLRFGIPPTYEVAKRIERINKELSKEAGKCIDGECSLCTGTAYSVFGLANEPKPKILSWLRHLKHTDYINLEKRNRFSLLSEHSMHYTASVLLGFIDNGNLAEIRECFSCFFERSENRPFDDPYVKWMQHRNITEADTVSYIFSSFLYYRLSNNDRLFSDEQKVILQQSLDRLILYLDNNSTDLDTTWRQYETRDNICSFILAILIGYDNERSLHFLLKNIQALRENVSDYVDFKDLLDSNVDRTRKRVEGWLLYWETLLFQIERSFDIKKYTIS